jgi:hypothetical protein
MVITGSMKRLVRRYMERRRPANDAGVRTTTEVSYAYPIRVATAASRWEAAAGSCVSLRVVRAGTPITSTSQNLTSFSTWPGPASVVGFG